jgi:NTE family protein
MDRTEHAHDVASRARAYDRVALVLQGGGALGAYQAGVYAGLCEHGIEPDWVAGISIGAINAAIIAGNEPGERHDRLKAFWEGISSQFAWPNWLMRFQETMLGALGRNAFNQFAASTALAQGQPGFFNVRIPPPWALPDGSSGATSYYDTSPLKATLERYVDFGRINSGKTRLSVGAVNVQTGNFVYFDSANIAIRPEHIMASGALPPGFPPVEIDGEFYWDGGLVSNTPLQYVLDTQPRADTLAFQVDLWSSKGELPTNLAAVAERQKDITYSSRTRYGTDSFEEVQNLRHAINKLVARMPEAVWADPELARVSQAGCNAVMTVIHLIYRRKRWETHNKDYEFSIGTMHEHWQAGYEDTLATLAHPEWLDRPPPGQAVATRDLVRAPEKNRRGRR